VSSSDIHSNDNSNINGPVIEIARSEMAGYRIARRALPDINVPDVLYFSHDSNNNSSEQQQEHDLNSSKNDKPWSVLAYVGEKSMLFNTTTNFGPDNSWMETMVKTRREYGFDEPHPRWGRVPEDECVAYTETVLRNVILPLHAYMHHQHYCFDNIITTETRDLRRSPPTNSKTNNRPSSTDSDSTLRHGFTYRTMVDLYQREHEQMKQTMAFTTSKSNVVLKAAVNVLGEAIKVLAQQVPYLQESPPSLVLCHMDLQPQNLIFATPEEAATTINRSSADGGRRSLPRISSVLDWEEAALADPRFELLLLCRKVCANRQQAEIIWRTYQRETTNYLEENALGPIQPWLALETVHSITSLLLQSMDLLGGGRSPWESKPDLQGKIQREIQRLVVEYGWTFCNVPEFR